MTEYNLTWILVAILGYVMSVVAAYYEGKRDSRKEERDISLKIFDAQAGEKRALQTKLEQKNAEIARITLEFRGQERKLLDELSKAKELAHDNWDRAEAYTAVCQMYNIPIGQLSAYINVLRQCAAPKKGVKVAKTKRGRKA